MQWDVQDGLRCDLFFFGGTGFAGDRWHVAIRKGEVRRGDVPGHMVKAAGLVALIGTRFIFKSHTGPDWEKHPWRAVHFTEEETFITGERHLAGPHKRAIHLADIDLLTHVAANRVDYDREEFFPQVETLAQGEGKGWTYGRNPQELKNNIHAVSVHRF